MLKQRNKDVTFVDAHEVSTAGSASTFGEAPAKPTGRAPAGR
jgi:hypothetical protein